jgi:hypothetical protein
MKKYTKAELVLMMESYDGDQLPTEYKDFTEQDEMGGEEEQPVDGGEEPTQEPDMAPRSHGAPRYTIGRGQDGTFYVIDQDSGHILAKK